MIQPVIALDPLSVTTQAYLYRFVEEVEAVHRQPIFMFIRDIIDGD